MLPQSRFLGRQKWKLPDWVATLRRSSARLPIRGVGSLRRSRNGLRKPCGILLASSAKGEQVLPTRLTQRRRSEGRGNKFELKIKSIALVPTKICEVCGAEGVKNRYCKSCAVEAARENMAQVALIGHSRPKTKRVKDRISKRISDHAVANTWWDPKSLPSWLTKECYVQRIQPLLRGKKVREIAEAMQVSQPYAAFIRSGRRRPHPRHWENLAKLVAVTA